MRYREALSNASCPNCGGPTAIGEMSFDEQHLRIENVRLREEVPYMYLLLSSPTLGLLNMTVILATS